MSGIPVNVEQFDTIACDCGSDVFMELSKLKLVPALMSPSNSPMPYPFFVTMACASCGKDIRFAMDRMEKEKTGGSGLIL